MVSSHSTQLAAAKAVAGAQPAMVAEWCEWLERRNALGGLPEYLVERKLNLIVDTLTAMLGPMRREAKVIWQRVMEQYGRSGVARGLATGEIVEEIQQLRLLLVRHIGEAIATMRPRRAVAVFLRLNAIIDGGLAVAVVGYTDTLVSSLMGSDESGESPAAASADDYERELASLESELATLTGGS